MRVGQWLQPRHASVEVFEKDYPQVDFSGLDLYCPGCKVPLKLSRRSAAGRLAGWCKKCNRAVSP
ncbi:MAG: hypothetical protein A3J74_01775 [Elusimicrobia bacterium RIFCSPHIGHO2_02_FULL_57_9]|nr:MAG: hypothetical protein A3J74_01775 [Elusimicrobia bacterium RIFCSPHIGHO2_02_FULL_57_9]